MLEGRVIEYPALIYKKHGHFIADCLMFNLASIGITESAAVENLAKCINNQINECNIIIKPIYWDNCAQVK